LTKEGCRLDSNTGIVNKTVEVEVAGDDNYEDFVFSSFYASIVVHNRTPSRHHTTAPPHAFERNKERQSNRTNT
jgi:hypothetical protein